MKYMLLSYDNLLRLAAEHAGDEPPPEPAGARPFTEIVAPQILPTCTGLVFQEPR